MCREDQEGLMLEGEYAGFKLEMRDKGVALITFDRPDRLNGFNIAMKRDLIEALVQLQYDDESRVVVFTGGPAFSAGDDFGAAFAEEAWGKARSRKVEKKRRDGLGSYGSLRTISQNLTRTVRALDKPTIAAIDGPAVQSGLSLALACDFRLAAPTAKLGSATLRMGFMPDEGGHFLIVQLLGVARAKDFLMRKRMVTGEEALALGLVNEVVPSDQLLDAAIALAEELAEGPQVALRLLKHAIDNAAELSFEQAAMDIAVRTGISDHHPDTKEGWKAFKERRKPRFA
jgi:2-(1,2-epoxy-1,2-dihydrophenyl)acetyl-CoA isomerase